MYGLEMPQAFAGLRVESDQTVAEEIVSLAVAAVKIEARRSERNIGDAALFIDGHLAPVVDAAGGFIELLRPGVITELAGMRDRVKNPCKLAGPDVVGMNVARNRFIAGASRRQWHDNHVGHDVAGILSRALIGPVFRTEAGSNTHLAVLSK